MRDAFDEFMDELRRRRAAQNGPDGATENGSNGESGAEPHAQDQAPDGEAREDEAVDTNRSGSGADGEPEGEDEAPRPVFRGGGFGGGFGGGRRSRSVGPSDDFPQITISRRWVVLFIAIIVAFSLITTFFTVGIQLTTDAIWYQSIGYAGVFWTRIWSQLGLFVLGAVTAFAAVWLNVWVAGRLIPKGKLRRFSLDDFLDRFNMDRYTGGGFGGGFGGGQPKRPGASASSVEVPDLSRPVFWTMLAIGILVALGLGGLLSSGWATIQLYAHQVTFQANDPTFGKNIGFYVFQLPFFRLVQSYVNTVLLVSIVVVGIRYLVAVVSGAPMSTPARIHLGILAMLYLWSIAIGYQLDRFELVYSTQSTLFTGVSYADANAKFLAFNAMTVVAGFAGAFILGFAYTRWRVPLLLTFMFWISAYVVLDVAYPQLVQRFVVVPNQQAQETPYISNNISMTRLAFGLEGWQSSTYTPQATVAQSDVESETATVQNMRLWDADPLGQTLDGLNVIRQYYGFPDVTTDRYTFTDAASCAPAAAPCVRQVMISGRELDPTKVTGSDSAAPSWVNLHITYTHGVGLVMVPVNEVVAPGGQPNLFIKDLPPVSVKGAPTITEPRIYFGSQPTVYSIVGAQSQEFDYPSGNNSSGDKYNNWTGTTGIKLDSTLTRLLFAARFGDVNLLISDQITNNSQLLMNRSIQERAQAIAPFLRFDKDPYLVVTSGGRLNYILDGYTTTGAFPDANSYNPGSDPTANGLAGDPFNYIRNSVKVVMDAYDGTMSFYVSDPTDPIIQAWQGVFPGVFKPLAAMPSDLTPHLRYPTDMFNAQTTEFAKYHVTDPGVFYQGNDLWQVPGNAGGSSGGPTQLPLEAYYVEMRVPGEQNPEFVLLQPMVPNGRKNMIAWVAAHMDPGAYGNLSIFDFPRDANVYGPVQVESLIAQTPAISQQITLWNTNGSKVTLGNLLVIPLKNSLLYVEPVYLAASSNALPAFQKVVVTNGSTVVWGNTLQDALTQLYAAEAANPGSSPSPGGSPSPNPGASPTPTATPGASGAPGASNTPLSTNAQVLISQASQYYAAAQDALGRRDLATYQKDMDIVGQLLAQLAQVVGTPAPSAS
jgi:uncharacterized membrane protein (UPF0182 family)